MYGNHRFPSTNFRDDPSGEIHAAATIDNSSSNVIMSDMASVIDLVLGLGGPLKKTVGSKPIGHSNSGAEATAATSKT